MELDLRHHKLMMLIFVLLVFITGIFVGVKVAGIAGDATTTLLVLLFGMIFLDSVLLYVIFTQLLHVQDGVGRKK